MSSITYRSLKNLMLPIFIVYLRVQTWKKLEHIQEFPVDAVIQFKLNADTQRSFMFSLRLLQK